ncbi:MAG: CaiB/BaiF CoA transferase family protein [Chloroflexota bacterium]
MAQPLEGITVLDLTRLLPGAVCTMMLVDMGADVIKIEDPNGGDYARWMGPMIDDQSIFFRMNNRGKRSAILNLKDPQGQAVLKKLVESADVLIEGFRPGVMTRLGCDYDTLRGINRRLVFCSLSGWGADGPYAAMPGHDLNYVSVAGMTGAMQSPQVLGGQVADIGGAYAALAGITAALFRRAQSGEGAYIDISLSESALPFMLYNWVEATAMGVPAGRGVLTGGLACYRIYRAGDGGYVALGALEDKFWANFCNAVDRPDLIEHHQVLDKQDYLYDELTALFARKGAAEWEALLGPADCCFSRVRPPAEVHTDPHYRARAMLGAFEDGTPWMRSPVRISNSAPLMENVVPGYGEHTEAVLLAAGYTVEDIAALREASIVR